MSDQIKNQLQQFFPGEIFTESSVEEALQNGDIFSTPDEILPYLQTALLDKKIIEVELDGIPRVYFTRIEDDPPETEEDDQHGPDGSNTDEINENNESEADENDENEAEYQEGDYLREKSHLITLPLEPGLGNLHLRHSRIITLRMFTKAYAVEFGATFADLTKIEELPVLKLNYPDIARVLRNAREYRAKVPESLDFVATIDTESDEEIIATPVDISVKGMAFACTKHDHRMLRIDDILDFKLYIDDELLVFMKGEVRHLSKIRKDRTIEYVCGVEFELDSQTTAAAVESLVAKVQRAHLQELAALSDKSGIDLIT